MTKEQISMEYSKNVKFEVTDVLFDGMVVVYEELTAQYIIAWTNNEAARDWIKNLNEDETTYWDQSIDLEQIIDRLEANSDWHGYSMITTDSKYIFAGNGNTEMMFHEAVHAAQDAADDLNLEGSARREFEAYYSSRLATILMKELA